MFQPIHSSFLAPARSLLTLVLGIAVPFSALSEESNRAANTIALDETAIKNLRIETVEVEEADFAETAFALGRIQVAPGKRAVVSSRIPGRVISVNAKIHQSIEKGAEIAVIESRQPGNPPPSIQLTAPISGLVSAVSIAPGQPVSPDDALVEIIDLNEVHGEASVPEHLIGKLSVGQKATLRVVSAPNRNFESEIEYLATQVDPENGTLEADFHIDNPGQFLRPGMRAEFSIILNQRTGVMSIPRNALQGDATNRFVFVEDFDLKNAFIKTPVVVGQTNDRSVEIISGLLPGDKVVTNGAYSLAFAGSSGISLKEALDAAHGHEHAADGSELKPEDQKKDDHDHEEIAPGNPLWKIVSGVLFILLLVSLFLKRKGR